MMPKLTKAQRIKAAAHFDAKSGEPCPNCGRSIERHLEIQEAYALFHYARTDCAVCLLTDHPRPTQERFEPLDCGGDGGQWSGL